MPEAEFTTAVKQAIALYEKVIGHEASYTWPMIERYGEIEALSRLVVSPDLQKGFKVLRDKGQLDITFESVVVRFQHLFKPDVVQAAQWRLDHPYDLF